MYISLTAVPAFLLKKKRAISPPEVILPSFKRAISLPEVVLPKKRSLQGNIGQSGPVFRLLIGPCHRNQHVTCDKLQFKSKSKSNQLLRSGLVSLLINTTACRQLMPGRHIQLRLIMFCLRKARKTKRPGESRHLCMSCWKKAGKTRLPVFLFFFDSCKENEKREATATLGIFPFSVRSKRKWRSSKRKETLSRCCDRGWKKEE